MQVMITNNPSFEIALYTGYFLLGIWRSAQLMQYNLIKISGDDRPSNSVAVHENETALSVL